MTVADDMGADDLKTEVPEDLRGPENREARMRWKYQIYMRDYLQCVQSIDDNVGRLLTTSTSAGLPRTPWSSTRRTRGSSSATTAGSTSG